MKEHPNSYSFLLTTKKNLHGKKRSEKKRFRPATKPPETPHRATLFGGLIQTYPATPNNPLH